MSYLLDPNIPLAPRCSTAEAWLEALTTPSDFSLLAQRQRAALAAEIDAFLGLDAKRCEGSSRLREFLLAGLAHPAEDRSSQGQRDKYLDYYSTGKMSYEDAAACLSEVKRTQVFIRAVRDALTHLEARFPHGPIHVLDVGCGPAPLWGMLTALESSRTSVVCLDMNPESCRSAVHVIRTFGLEHKVTVRQANALTVDPQQFAPCHLIVSETIDCGLANEKIVGIANRFTPALARGGVFIPEEIKVFSGVIADDLFEAQVHPGGRLQHAKTFTFGDVHNVSDITIQAFFPGTTSGLHHRVLANEIRVFREHTLSFFDSTVCGPHSLERISGASSAATRRYQAGELNFPQLSFL